MARIGNPGVGQILLGLFKYAVALLGEAFHYLGRSFLNLVSGVRLVLLRHARRRSPERAGEYDRQINALGQQKTARWAQWRTLPARRRWEVRAASLLVAAATVLAVPFVPPRGDLAISAESHAASTASQEAYLLTWTAKATSSGGGILQGITYVVHYKSEMRGFAVIHVNPDGTSYAFPIVLTVTDERDQVTQSPCGDGGFNNIHSYDSIIDPTRWTGSRSAVNTPYFPPQRRPNGTYYLPYQLAFWYIFTTNGTYETFRKFTTRSQADEVYCGGSSSTRSGTVEWIRYLSMFMSSGGPPFGDLEGDPTGWTFSSSSRLNFNLTPGAKLPQPVTVEWEVQLRRAGKCANQSPPIDDSDPSVTNVDVALDADASSISPDGETKLKAKVTCDGVPVRNASVEVKVDAQRHSGNHQHDNAAVSRPRGFLNKTKLTDAKPSITVKTNDQGMAVITFNPGKAERGGNCDVCGIAGIYEVTATSVRFKDRTAKKSITAEVTGLIGLPAGANYVLTGVTATHPVNHFGTQATIDAITALATEYQNAQGRNNLRRIYPLSVNDISLPQGGFFDWRHNWAVTHQTHGQGFGFDVDHNFSRRNGSPEERILRSVGEQYGSWDQADLRARPPMLHLHVTQSGASHSSTSPKSRASLSNKIQNREAGLRASGPVIAVLSWLVGPTEIAAAAPGQREAALQASGPDIAVLSWLVGPAEIAAAAPGQSVTYMVGVDNLQGSTDAHNVVLTVTLPAGLSFVSASPAPTRKGGSGQMIWDLGTLAARALPPTIDLVARVDPTVVPGTLLMTSAEVTTSDAEKTLKNNRSDMELSVEALGPDLVVSSDLAGAAMTVDRPVTFQITVANQGNAPASGAMFTLTLPNLVKLRSASVMNPATSQAGVTWTLGDMKPGASQAITVSLDLDPRLNPGTPLGFTLTATSRTPDIDQSNNREEVVKSVEFAGSDLAVSLAVEGADAPDTLRIGQDVTYTIRYTNIGSQVAHKSVLTLSLWSGLSLKSAQPAQSRTTTNTNFAGGVVIWDLGDLPIGASGVIRAQVHVRSVPKEGSLVLATISTSDRDINQANNSSLDRRHAAPGK